MTNNRRKKIALAGAALSRRQFLTQGGKAVIAGAVLISSAGCDDDDDDTGKDDDTTAGETGDETGGETGDETGGETGGETGNETGGETGGETGNETGGETGDETGNETGNETGGETGDETGGETGGETGDEPEDLSKYPKLVKGPWVTLMAGGTARIRFETEGEARTPVRVTRAGVVSEVETTATAADVTFKVPAIDSLLGRVKYPDVPGRYAMQDAVLTGLVAGEVVTYSVPTPEGRIEGSFKAGAAAGEGFTLGWIADTMTPNHEKSSLTIAQRNPDLVIHGGDIQYIVNPLDSWSGAFAAFAPFMRKAATHFVVGNHEYETDSEFDAQYGRLIATQGDSGTVEYHAFTYGWVRFIVLNTELDLADAESEQRKWLDAELAGLDEGLVPVMCFHRPYFTFSNSKPKLDFRDALHPIFKAAGVGLVMTGHNHGYERFEFEGVSYILEAGGGAFLYASDENREEVLKERPGDAELRKFAVSSYGATMVTFGGDGTITGERFDNEGNKVDTFTVAKRG